MQKTKQNLQDIFNQHSPNKPMSKEITMFYMNCMLSPNDVLKSPMKTIDKESKEYKHFEGLINEFVVQVFLKRLQNLGNLDIDLETLVVMTDSLRSPGSAVMYAYYLYMKCAPNSVVNLDTFAQVFPMGTFTYEQLDEIWDAQKVSEDTTPNSGCYGALDNLLDYYSPWE